MIFCNDDKPDLVARKARLDLPIEIYDEHKLPAITNRLKAQQPT